MGQNAAHAKILANAGRAGTRPTRHNMIFNARWQYCSGRWECCNGALERESNMPMPDEMERRIGEVFSDIDIVKKIYAGPETSRLSLVVVYDWDSVSGAIERIHTGFAILKDEFPGVYLDTHLFDVDEIHEGYYGDSADF